jgi:hypothetical protein
MIGLVAGLTLSPPDSELDEDPGAVDAGRSRQAPGTDPMAAIAIAIVARKILPGRHPPRTWAMNYFLFIGGSSTKLRRIRSASLGSLLHNRDLHSTLLRNRAGDVMCQRHYRRFHAGLVTCRRVHVTNL